MVAVCAPTLAAITLHRTGGGIAAVSELLWRVFREQWGSDARLLTVFDHDNRPATMPEKVRFSLASARAQALRQTDWLLFSHLALARGQHALPAAVRRRYGIFLHGIEAWRPLGRGDERALAGAELLLANSSYTAKRFAQAHPSIGPVVVCPLALVPDDAIDNRPGADPALPPLGRHAVLVVGRMVHGERYKGHDQLIDAWPEVLARVPDAQLVIAGTGDDEERLKQRAEAGVGARSIIFTGFVTASSLDALYEKAAMFALPSRGEGFGLVYLEAMAHRLACLGSVHDAAGDVIDDGVTGCLVDQDDVRGMAETIASLLIDAGRRRQMGDAGYARLKARFTFDSFSDRLRAALPADGRAAIIASA